MFLKRWLALLLILAAPVLWAQDSCSLSECRYNVPLDRSGTYIAVVTLPSGQADGLWSLIINPGKFSPQYLNGFWAGSILKERSELPNWVAFSLSRTTPINITPYDWIGDGSPLTLQIDKDIGGGQRQLVYGPTLMNQGQTYTTQPLDPGFYITGLLSQPESVRTYRGLALEAQGLFGGVVGGYLDSFSGVGYGAFLINSPEIVEFLLVFGDTFGNLGASQPQLDIYYQHEDGTRELSWSRTAETNLPPAPDGDEETTTNPPDSGNGEGETTNPPTDSTVPRIIDWGTPPEPVTPASDEATKEMMDMAGQTYAAFLNDMRELRQTMSGDEAIQIAINNLKNNPDVVAVHYQSNSLTIYNRLGGELTVLLDSQYPVEDSPNSGDLRSSFSTQRRTVPKRASQKSSAEFLTRSVTPSGNKTALVYSGFQWQFRKDLCPIKRGLEEAGYAVDFIVDIDMCGEPATTFDEKVLTYLNKLHTYDVVYINSHGSVDSFSTGVSYGTYQEGSDGKLKWVDEDNPPKIKFLTQHGGKAVKIGVITVGSIKAKNFRMLSYLSIKSDFLSHLDGNFKNSMLHFDGCHTAEIKANFPDKALKKGAAVYIGYNQTKRALQSREFSIPLFSRITNPGTSVRTAISQEPRLPTHWILEEHEECTAWFFYCRMVMDIGTGKNPSVTALVYRSDAVKNDPEGFVLVPTGNNPPTASIEKPSDGSKFSIGEQITFDGNGIDEDGSIVSYQWVFGDDRDSQTAKNPTAQWNNFTYDKAGTYTVYLLVTDDQGAVGEDSIQITITEPQDETGEIGNTQIIGVVKDAVNEGPLIGVVVSVYKDNILISEITTNDDGSYSVTGLLANTDYQVTISKTGYLAETMNIQTSSDAEYYLETVLQISEQYAGIGDFGGQITDALTGNGVSGLSIAFRKGINVKVGTVVDTVTTDSDGNYLLSGLEAGNYTGEITGAGYTTAFFTALNIGSQTTGSQDATVTPVLSEGETRVVLTWGASPKDLDSHMTGPIPESDSRFHVYWDRDGSQSSSPYTFLDRDDEDYEGPETITIVQQFEGVYRFSVHDYSNKKEESSSRSLANSGAKVEVYRGSNLVRTFNVPNTDGTLWTVFELNGNDITPLNTMEYVKETISVQALDETDTDRELLTQLPEKQ